MQVPGRAPLLGLLILPGALAADRAQLTALTLPARSGVAAEVRTIIDAPAARVARLVGDPAAFQELLPAAEVRIVGREGAGQLVELMRREPWPVGEVRWTERVLSRTEGNTFVIERRSQGQGYFRHLEAIWRVTPLGDDERRCMVSYRVSMETVRWVPQWILRRANTAAMVVTVERLRRLSGS